MSTIHPESTQRVDELFTPAERKYDLRTNDGKFWKQFAELSEYATATGDFVYGPTTSNEAIRITRFVEPNFNDVIQYLSLKVKYDYSSRNANTATLVIINDALVSKDTWGTWHWSLINATIHKLKDGKYTETEFVTEEESAVSKLGIPRDAVSEVRDSIARWQAEEERKDGIKNAIAQAKESFVPSYDYEIAKRTVQKFVEEGVEPSRGDHNTWHNHVHVAIDTEVHSLCVRFLELLGSTNAEHSTLFDLRLSALNGTLPIYVIDETVAYATVVAERVSRGWSSNDFSSSLIGQVLHQFTSLVKGRSH